MSNEQETRVMWTISGFRTSDKGPIFAPAQTFGTKREAITALMTQREPKTAIMKHGHAYSFQLAK